MRKIWPAIVFAILIVAAGVLHGMRTERWRPTSGVAEAIQALDNVPLEFGDWQGKRTKLDEADLARAGIKGHFWCAYRHARSGSTFAVLLVCGRSGPISVHTPDICYEAAGFEASGPPQLQEVHFESGATQTFWTGKFRKPSSASAAHLEIFWAWNGGDGWSAPENPRLALSRHPVLYKLYVVREVSPRAKSNVLDSFKDFLEVFLPELNRVIAPRSVS
jgi:hypothetical protein